MQTPRLSFRMLGSYPPLPRSSNLGSMEGVADEFGASFRCLLPGQLTVYNRFYGLLSRGKSTPPA